MSHTKKPKSLLNILGDIVCAVEKKTIEKKREEGTLTKSFIQKKQRRIFP
jgi:hypothetical protein